MAVPGDDAQAAACSSSSPTKGPPNILSTGTPSIDTVCRKSNPNLLPPGAAAAAVGGEEEESIETESRRGSSMMTAEEEKRALMAFNQINTNKMLESIDGIPVFREGPMKSGIKNPNDLKNELNSGLFKK